MQLRKLWRWGGRFSHEHGNIWNWRKLRAAGYVRGQCADADNTKNGDAFLADRYKRHRIDHPKPVHTGFPDDEADCWLSRHGGRRSISGSKSEQFRNGLATKLRPRHDTIDDAIPLSGKFRELERFPLHGNCVIEKKSLRFKELEHVLIEKFEQLFWDMLQGRLISLYERIEPPSVPVDST